jgi:beta-lactamase class C
MKTRAKSLAAAVLFVLCATTAVSHAADDLQHRIKSAVDMAIQPVIAKYRISGMAVGIVVSGKPYAFSYGVASTESRPPVTRDTLFEIGSITKTFTATLSSMRHR